MASGLITNGDSSHTDARISSYFGDGIRLGTGTIHNYGTIGSYAGTFTNGIDLQGAGTITNRGSIYGATGILVNSNT